MDVDLENMTRAYEVQPVRNMIEVFRDDMQRLFDDHVKPAMEGSRPSDDEKRFDSLFAHVKARRLQLIDGAFKAALPTP